MPDQWSRYKTFMHKDSNLKKYCTAKKKMRIKFNKKVKRAS